MISRGGSVYARAILGMPVNDMTGGYNAWKRAVLEKLACPECAGALEVAESGEENAVRILQGALRCTACGRRAEDLPMRRDHRSGAIGERRPGACGKRLSGTLIGA